MLHATLCANSADKKMIFFFLILSPRKQDLTFHANCNGDNLHEMSKPVFLGGKKRKKNSVCRLLKISIKVGT